MNKELITEEFEPIPLIKGESKQITLGDLRVLKSQTQIYIQRYSRRVSEFEHELRTLQIRMRRVQNQLSRLPESQKIAVNNLNIINQMLNVREVEFLGKQTRLAAEDKVKRAKEAYEKAMKELETL